VLERVEGLKELWLDQEVDFCDELAGSQFSKPAMTSFLQPLALHRNWR